jgi:hypothetical protein
MELSVFLLVVFVASAPLWVAAYFLDAARIIPVKLPFSALQFLCVLVAAIVTTRLAGGSVLELLRRGGDVGRIPELWRPVVFLLMPVTVFVSYLLTRWSGGLSETRATPLASLPAFVVVYGVSGYCEEIGWTAVMGDLLLKRYGVIRSGLLIGVTWAVWHLIPFIQTHNGWAWFFWQCMFSVVFRLILVQTYVLTGRSVFAAIALHASYNVAFSMLPYYGSTYNPMYMTFATLVLAVLILSVRAKRSGDELM